MGDQRINIAALTANLYYVVVENTSEILNKPVQWSIFGAAEAAFIPASQTVVVPDHGSGSVTAVLKPVQSSALDARCLWCDRTFTPRTTGGSAQKFCCTEHRQEFWIAARRWTMRAIEVGLLSVDCLKASHTSVHAG